MNNLKISSLPTSILTALILSMSVISAQAAGVTHTLTTTGASDWTTATWTNGAPDSTSAGDKVTYATSSRLAATTTLDVNGVVFGQISGYQTFDNSGNISHWVINKGAGTSFTLDNTGGLVNPFGNFDASITSSAVGSLLTVNPDIVIQNTNLSIGIIQNYGVIVNGNITASSARTLTLVNNSNSSGGVFEINGSIGATGSAIAIQTSHTTNGGFSFPITIKGALGSSVASLTHNAATDLHINYATTASELINNDTPISLGYGARYYQVNNTTSATTETVNSFGLAGGQSTLTLNGGVVDTYAKLDIGSFSRSNNATALVRGTNLGAAASGVAGNRIVIGSGLVEIGTNTSSSGAGVDTGDKQLTIVPYFIGGGGTGGLTSVGTNFLTLDTHATTGGLRLLGTNEQATVAAAVSGDNVKTTGVVNTTGSKTFNSLLITGNVVSSLTGDNTGVLNITSGALASVMTAATGDFDLSGFTGIVFGTTGANEAVITNTNITAGGILTIASPISTASLGGGLTKAGLGTVVLAADNTYTGPTTINQSVLQIGNGTTGSLNSTGTITIAAGDANVGESIRGTLSLNMADGGVLGNTIVNNGLIVKGGSTVNTLSGGISGSGGITISNATGGVLALSGTAKSYTGNTTMTNGALRVVGDVMSTSSLLLFNPGASQNPTLQLRADTGTVFQNGGTRWTTGSNVSRNITFDVDQATVGNSNQVLTLAGTLTFDRPQGVTLNDRAMVNVTGANGYGLVLENILVDPNSSGGARIGLNVSAPGGLTVNTVSSADNNPQIIDVLGAGNTKLLAVTRATNNLTVQVGQEEGSPLSGNLTLAGAASTTGSGTYTFNLLNGTLNVNHANALGSYDAGNVTFNRRLNLGNGTLGATLDNTSGAAITVLNSNAATTTASSFITSIEGNFTFGSTDPDSKALTLNVGSGSGQGTMRGYISLGGGVGASRTITTNGDDSLTLNGGIANGAVGNSLIKEGTATLVLGSTNFYTGGTTVNSGTLEVNGDSVVAQSSLVGTRTAAGTTITGMDSAAVANLRVGQAVSGTGIAAGTVISGKLSTTSVALSLATTASTAADLAVTAGSGLGTGAVTLNGGTLLINPTGNINSVSGVTVNTGSTFRYNSNTIYSGGAITNAGGSIAGTGNLGAITLGGTGSIDPGNSPGLMTVGATNPTSGLDYNFEFTLKNGALNYASVQNDVLRLTLATPFTAPLGTGNVISLYLDSATYASLTEGDFLRGGFYTDSGNFLSSISGATITAYYQDVSGSTSYNGTNYSLLSVGSFGVTTVADPGLIAGGYITQFAYTTIPEPSTYAMLFGGLGLLAFLRRRRQS